MFFLLTGEGKSDIGYETSAPGPLVTVLEQLASLYSDESFDYEIIGRQKLNDAALPLKQDRKSMSLRGCRRKYPALIFIHRQVQALALLAQQIENTGAVFFHDCDFTTAEISDADEYYRQMVLTVENGFYSIKQYGNGVAMIPKPRSESWFLSFYQKTPYKNGSAFELLPGNDSAPNSGKKLLAQFFGCPVNQIYNHIHAEEILWDKINAPSFLFFKKRFRHVVQKLTHQTCTVLEIQTLMTTANKSDSSTIY